MSRDSRYRAKYWDPEGAVYGIPTYWWKGAPEGLATRRQLRAMGLCPGGVGPVAQVLWMRRRKDAVAYLYSVAAAKPKRVPTAAQLVAVGKALPRGGPARAAGGMSAIASRPASASASTVTTPAIPGQGWRGVRAAVVSIETDEVWALVDLRQDQDAVLATRFAVCETCGLLSAVPAGELPVDGERWATLADLPAVLRQ